MLDQNGSTYKLEKGILRVIKGSMVVLKGILKQGLYILQGEVISGDAAISSIENDETVLGHKRLGHIGSRGLQELRKQEILDPKKVRTLDFREFRALEKSQRLKFNTARHQTKSILEYIHSDL